MSLYPTLEDMKVDQMAQAQIQHEQRQAITQGGYPAGDPAPHPHSSYPSSSAALYPSLDNYMGLQLTPQFVQENMPVVAQNMQVAQRQTPSQSMVAPITGNANKGLMRAEIKQGIREVVLCKDEKGMLGVRVRHVNNGLFVALVMKNSPAALAGLRFGDQILTINGQTMAGWDNDKAHNFIKKLDPQRITMAVRDRPFERTISMQKDSNGYIGFVFKDGKIKSLVKDSSAARNGVLTDHQLVEVNGQNVVGLKDSEIGEIIDAGGRTITVTIMPSFLYDHVVKCMGNSLIKRLMDSSIPDL
ncbi:syntenin-1-like [Babylonia areolata]|uniref:syntenin-1-like n=1 Tax=Babylonia areolata TaxID=304850 RepID=UPI003FD3B7A7